MFWLLADSMLFIPPVLQPPEEWAQYRLQCGNKAAWIMDVAQHIVFTIDVTLLRLHLSFLL